MTKVPNHSQKSKNLKNRVKRKKQRKNVYEDEHAEILNNLKARYGTRRGKDDDEVKTAKFYLESKEIKHPSSFNRMMARSIEAHLNRLTQPESPENLIQMNWLCAICQNRSCFSYLGDLFGPYFVKLSKDFQPPNFLIPATTFVAAKSDSSTKPFITTKSDSSTSTKPSTSKISVPSTQSSATSLQSQMSTSSKSVLSRQKKTIREGTIDIWFHGKCALWAPGLFLVGGRIPLLQKQLTKYWKQKCCECSRIGATIAFREGIFIHYNCAIEHRYRLNELTFSCLPPIQ